MYARLKVLLGDSDKKKVILDLGKKPSSCLSLLVFLNIFLYRKDQSNRQIKLKYGKWDMKLKLNL